MKRVRSERTVASESDSIEMCLESYRRRVETSGSRTSSEEEEDEIITEGEDTEHCSDRVHSEESVRQSDHFAVFPDLPELRAVEQKYR